MYNYVAIQLQTAIQGKPTGQPVCFMRIKTHEHLLTDAASLLLHTYLLTVTAGGLEQTVHARDEYLSIALAASADLLSNYGPNSLLKH